MQTTPTQVSLRTSSSIAARIEFAPATRVEGFEYILGAAPGVGRVILSMAGGPQDTIAFDVAEGDSLWESREYVNARVPTAGAGMPSLDFSLESLSGQPISVTIGTLSVSDGTTDFAGLQSLSVRWGENGATISWQARDGDGFGSTWYVHRQQNGGPREAVSSAFTGLGILTYWDSNPPHAGCDYWIREIDRSGRESWYGPATLQPFTEGAPSPVLDEVFPNPASANVLIRFRSPLDHPFSIEIYDLLGRRVRKLADGRGTIGPVYVEWDGRQENGSAAPSGVYFLRLTAGSQSTARRVMIVRDR